MKKLLLLFFFSIAANAQIVFPDADLKAILLSAGPGNPIAFTEASYPDGVTIDTNGDGEIQLSEALPITRLHIQVFSSPLHNLEGLQYFPNLEEYFGGVAANNVTPVNHVKRLSCWFNGGSLDIAAFSQLEELNVYNSSYLGSLHTGSLPNLKILRIADNRIDNLDLSGVPNLTILDFSHNRMMGFPYTPPDLSGLAHLTELYCGDNSLTSLNLSPMVNLTKLYCLYNPLETLDVSQHTNLKELSCYNTQITSIDVSMLPNLEILNIGQNAIPAVNIISGGNLKELNIQYTQISELNTTPFTNLKRLICGNGSLIPMTSLTLTPSLDYLAIDGYAPNELTLSLPLLKDLDIRSSSMRSLDFSSCPVVNNLYLSGNSTVEYINGKNGGNYSAILTYNPNLLLFCTNEQQVQWLQWTIPTTDNNLNCQINSYCSFTPGGLYNTITGKIRFDNEDDGCDANDVTFPYTKVTLNDGAQTGIVFSDLNGDYKFYTQTAGDFALTAQMENPSYYTITPNPATFNVATIDGSATTADFCITANGIHPDAEVMIVPLGQARPGFDANYQVVYRNKGNKTLSGWISIAFDDARTDFVSANPGMTQTGSTLVFDYADLAPFETRSADFKINLNSPMETPALNDGDILHFEASMAYAIPAADANYTTANLNQIIVNSLDPNDKTCIEGNTISPGMIGNYVHYNINFENIGTAEAVNIVVKDQIDTNKFDINTLQVIYASHPVTTRIIGNRVDFIFGNINLPGTSGDNKGNVLFKIKTKPTLVLGNSISNKAEIFFDYNFPIETNEATSTFAVLKNQDFTVDATIGIYPNPSKGKINVKANSNIRSLQLFDIQGRILQTSTENSKDVSIDISGKQNGIYFLNVTTEKGSKTEKLLKE